MRIMRSGVVVGAIVFGVAVASGATGAGSTASSCGHEAELVAAKRALQRGDRASALEHLKKADAMLARCIRGGASVPAQDEGRSAETERG